MHSIQTKRNLYTAGIVILQSVFCLKPGIAVENDAGITVNRYQLEGNSLLSEQEVETAISPYLGEQIHLADLQKALEALTKRYRAKGFSEVLLTLPEQELTNGTVYLKVIEPKLKTIRLHYSNPALQEFYPESNVLGSLPDLKIAEQLHTDNVSSNLQLANENPARQLEVTLDGKDTSGQLDALVKVKGVPPRKAYMTIDNTGTDQTGEYRIGFGLQHANLWGLDHIATFNYMTPIDRPDHVNLFSGSYRIPLYALGNSIDITAAKSEIGNTTTPSVAGPLQFSGSGNIYGLNYNHLLLNWGEYTHRIVTGVNYRQFNNSCSLANFGTQDCGPTSYNITLLPFSLSYNGQLNQKQQSINFYLAAVENIPGLPYGRQNDFNLVRPANIGTNGAPANYILFKGGYNYTALLGADWQIRLAGNGQYSRNALVYAEQFSLAGNTMVRGFWEREATRDIGYVLNTEFYSPDVAQKLGVGDYLRGLVFYDYGNGHNNALPGGIVQPIAISSVGIGLRLGYKQSLQFKLDGAYVLDGAFSHQPGDMRAHLSAYIPYSF